MSTLSRRLLVFLAISSAAQHANADNFQAAYDQGMECLQQLDCKCALSWFEKAQAQGAPAVVWYEIGEAQKCLQHTVEAEAAMARYLAEDPQMSSSTRAMVESERAQLDDYLAKLVIETEIPGATISVDDRVIGNTPLPSPVKLLPGRHVVTKTRSSSSSRREISLKEGERARIVLPEQDASVLNVVRPVAGVRNRSQPALRHGPPARGHEKTSSRGYVGIAAGAGIGVAAAVLHLLQRNDYKDWQARDARLSANPTAAGGIEAMKRNDELADSIYRERVAAAVLGVTSGALIAGGVALLAWDSTRQRSPNGLQSARSWTASLTGSSAVVGWRSTW